MIAINHAMGEWLYVGKGASTVKYLEQSGVFLLSHGSQDKLQIRGLPDFKSGWYCK